MKNLVRFETADKPLTSGKSKFPYDAVLNSLKVLDSTKSVVISDKECKGGNIYLLRKHAARLALGKVKACKQDGKYYIWLNDKT